MSARASASDACASSGIASRTRSHRRATRAARASPSASVHSASCTARRSSSGCARGDASAESIRVCATVASALAQREPREEPVGRRMQRLPRERLVPCRARAVEVSALREDHPTLGMKGRIAAAPPRGRPEGPRAPRRACPARAARARAACRDAPASGPSRWRRSSGARRRAAVPTRISSAASASTSSACAGASSSARSSARTPAAATFGSTREPWAVSSAIHARRSAG